MPSPLRRSGICLPRNIWSLVRKREASSCRNETLGLRAAKLEISRLHVVLYVKSAPCAGRRISGRKSLTRYLIYASDHLRWLDKFLTFLYKKTKKQHQKTHTPKTKNTSGERERERERDTKEKTHRS